MKKKTVLHDHKRVGKRFIPPFMQIPGIRETSYVDDMLPELIWLGLVNDRIGFVKGARFLEGVVAASLEATGSGFRGNCALLSSYNSLNQIQQETFIGALSTKSLLNPLKEYVAPLLLLYEKCPINFLGHPETGESKEDLIKTIKSCVWRHLDKYDTPGIILNAMMFISRLAAKTIHISPDISLPNFNAILEEPESDEAKRAAGFIRAHAIGDFMMPHIDNSWANYFWNRGYDLSPCEFDYADNE